MTQTHADGLVGTTAIVTGASRGFGRSIAVALTAAGAEVVGVARTAALLDEAHAELGDAFIPVVADAADPATAAELIEKYAPRTLVLCAGAAPQLNPVQEQSWESFSANWSVDVAQAFHWSRSALRRPLAPGSAVILMSSGAAVNGSPLSGGYAGAKATVKFIGSYAADESNRARLGITFASLLPRLTPVTDLGAKAAAAYAAREGLAVDKFVESTGPALTAEHVGDVVVALATGDIRGHDAYLLAASGLTPLAGR
ncbi:SDR family oxidoreductase [Mycobacterium sherrisii]|uniref:SDR family oxidoreductase n=1 Tax=Mycobacterium sherrisii TaxID=243061 RepID=UPI002DDD02DD|nr:SDR family oxidoreductase [Mycobacterium sherrisii]MEC4762658.1 SDR family oxidoreductase [Mycobacterium sherrisii]